jgi:hypothetical protein
VSDRRLGRIPLIALGALLVSLAGLAALFVGAWLGDYERALQSYLYAYLFWLGLSLGSLGMLMLHHLSGGRWGLLVRRPFEAATRVLPLMAVLLVPILIAANPLFGWTNPSEAIKDTVQKKDWYLNLPWFYVRAGLYILIWNLLALLLNLWSLQQDRAANPALAVRLRGVSAAGLIFYVLTMTFAAFDWVMSLVPQFASTVFGVIIITGQLLSATALGIVVSVILAPNTRLSEVASPDRYQDLGSLLEMWLLFWTYLVYSQFINVWMANLPDEISWYLPRLTTGWHWLGLAIIVLHMVVPFVLLLMRWVKRRAWAVGSVAALLLFMHLVMYFWQIMPSVHPSWPQFTWTDAAAPLGVGGLWIAVFLFTLNRWPLVPRYAPDLERALAHV